LRVDRGRKGGQFRGETGPGQWSKKHLGRVREAHERMRLEGYGGVGLPDALTRK